MSVRQRIERAIQELESPEQQAGASSRAAQQLEGDVSSVSLGLSEYTQTGNSGDDEATPGTSHQQRALHAAATTATHRRSSGGSSSGGSSGGLRRHVTELESKVLELLLDRKALEARHGRELAGRDAEIDRLQVYIDDELAELQQRQAQVEAAAPNVRQQLQEARAVLQGNLLVSAEAYAQLRRTPADRRPLADAVKIAVHEALRELSVDNERLRLTSSAARESAARHAEELARLQRDNARLEAALATSEAERDRVTAQLQGSIIGAEVGRAKVLLYDELAAKAEKLEAEVARLAGIEAAAERLRGQLAGVDTSLADRDAALALLSADKNYLSKELQLTQARAAELGSRLAAAEEKVNTLKGERARLYEQLAASADAGRSSQEARWEGELARLQASAASDLQRIRQEAAEAAEREARLLRDMRDTALDEASRSKAELRALREAHEELLLASRESASRADVANSQLMGELQLKAFELSRLQALSEERASAVERLMLQLELANEKTAVLSAEISQLEQESRQAQQQLREQLAEASTRLQEYTAADSLIERAVTSAADAGEAAMSHLEQQLAGLLPAAAGAGAAHAPKGSAHATLSAALQRRIHHNIQLAARCSKLEDQRQAAEADRAELASKLEAAQAAAQQLQRQLALAGQPQAELLKQLAAAEAAASAARAHAAQLEDALAARQVQGDTVAAERAALRRDLERLLRERGTLDSLRRMVAAAMSGGQPGGAAPSDVGPPADQQQPRAAQQQQHATGRKR